ncbi:MAG: FAD-dependent monooxygenase, partial [Pseudomonadota bacterium]
MSLEGVVAENTGETVDAAVEVAVVGGGPTGALAALCAADAGWRTALIAPDAADDPRTTALLMPAIELMESLGVWQGAQDAAAPLVTMRLIDVTGRLPRAPEVAFDAHEAGLEEFGFNVPNDALNAAFAERLQDANVLRIDTAATSIVPGKPALIGIQTQTIAADLIVAADGANSMVRRDCGFSVRRWNYDQAAFVTTLSHERPHSDTSTEFHTAAGPFTLVPLPGDRSSLVWVGRPDEVARWASLPPGPLAREIEARAHNILGRMRVDGPRGTIALEGVVAHRFGRDNVVLVGEAGHRFPPIGAQGLNLGMRDCAVLYRLLAEARADRSLRGVADAYDRRRRFDVNARTV